MARETLPGPSFWIVSGRPTSSAFLEIAGRLIDDGTPVESMAVVRVVGDRTVITNFWFLVPHNTSQCS
jgi:hypothetical protein